MSALILDGRATGNALLSLLAKEVDRIQTNHHYRPCLCVIRVGEDPASQIYVQKKIQRACELGIESIEKAFPENVGEAELLEKIQVHNTNPAIHGLLIQLPLPAHIDTKKILNAINPEKDVDGLHFINQGRLYTDQPGIYPCTPLGCYLLLQKYQINPAGQHVVVLGRSRLVGKPVGHMMLFKDATVTMCHMKTPDIRIFTKTADILISAVGQPDLVKADMIKEGSIIIDVGISKTSQGIKGDVDFRACVEKARAITPVPGGIGPMTVACLMYNTLIAASRQNNHSLHVLPVDPLRQDLWHF